MERHGRLFGRAAGRATKGFAIPSIMTDTARIIALWPRWTLSVGVMQRLQIQVRTQCRRCGALMRADLDDLVARHGASASLIDRQERCRMVACDGATFYLAARRHGEPWRILLDAAALRDGLSLCPPAHLAHGRPAPVALAADLRGPGRR
ncbi:hypothetical protein SBA_pBAR4_0500 (plasmid) [Sphingomonas bisphenolicum]|uniref:DUF222 domain-containing protein n=2 Tax=Alphaproteobacteria TaxID=28211 RepID=A0ABM7GB55_9SPHN|nr:hypothetical protein SBA_pBAR4_0500 [Sphingomonas bisphenolicum]